MLDVEKRLLMRLNRHFGCMSNSRRITWNRYGEGFLIACLEELSELPFKETFAVSVTCLLEYRATVAL